MSEPGYVRPDYSLPGEEHGRRYQATDGGVCHLWNGVPTLLLTTTGRRSGRQRTTPLIFATEGGDRLVAASMGGPVVARTAPAEEKLRLWRLVNETWSDYDVYQPRTEPDIPVVVLSPASDE
jgi:F420H(2)-dependent quinone reductase